MQQLFSAGIIVYRCAANDDIEYLVLRHAPQGHWDFPKGGIEAGENRRQAAHRELMEEAGITADLDEGFEQSLGYTFTRREGNPAHKTVTFFVGKAHADDVRLSDEHDDYAWLSYDDARKRLTYDVARVMLAHAHTFLKTIDVCDKA